MGKKKEYSGYVPPFDITDEITNLVIEIAENMGRLQDQTGLSESGVKKIIRQLRSAGQIVRIGGAKGGHWEVIVKKEGI